VKPVPVIVLGCSGNCVDILDCMLETNRLAPQPVYEPLGFLDDNADLQGTSLHDYPILGPLKAVADFPQAFFVSAIGSAQSFRAKPRLLQSLGLPRERFVSICHPSAQVSRWAHLGLGCVILQQVTLAAGARLDDHVVVLPSSVVSHDAHIEDYCILAGGVIVSGFTHVESNCYLGAGSVIRERVRLGAGALIGMGSVVVSSVPAGQTVIGNPARCRPPTS